MAYVLQLSDGTNTIDFLGSSGVSWCLLEDGGLEITNPTKREMWSGSGAWRFGRELASFAYDNRKIRITFEIVGDDRDDILDKKTALVNLIELARDSQIRSLATPVYLKYQLDNTTNHVYFDVLDGELTLPLNIMSLEALSWTVGSGQPSIKGFSLELTCKPFARGEAVQLVSGTTVYPVDDTSRNNYVSWNGSAVKGDIAGPLTVRFLNTSSGIPNTDIYGVWMGLRDHGTPSNWTYNVLEGEDATWVGSTTPYSDANYSGGSAYGVTIASTDDYRMCHWDIPDTTAANVIDLRGRVRVIALGYFPQSAQFWITMRKWITDYVIYPRAIPGVYGSVYVCDLGVIDLLAWGIEPDQGAASVELTLWTKLATAGQSVRVDALYMIPAEDYKFRSWKWMGYRQLTSTYMEDIGISNQLAYGVTFKAFTAEPSGLPIHATPGNDARLYFTWYTPTGSYYGNGTASVYVWHTPYYVDLRGTD